MTGMTGIDEERAPRIRHVAGMFETAEGIIAAGNDDRRAGERLFRIGTEGHQVLRPDCRIGDLGRSDQKRAGDLLFELRNGLNEGRDPQ